MTACGLILLVLLGAPAAALGQSTPPPAAAATAHPAAEDGRTLIDHAAATLAQLAADQADTSALAGVLSAEQQERVSAAAREALAMLTRAETRLAEEVAALESGIMGREADPAAAARRAAEVEAELSRVIDIEQGLRLPFYRGLASALLAGASDGQPRNAAAAEAVQLLQPLQPGTPEADGPRRVALAAALLMTVPLEPAVERRAEALLAEVDDQRGAAPARAARQAALLRHLLVVLRADDPVALAAQSAVAPDLAEAAARALLLRSRQDASRRSTLIGAACRVLLAAQPATTDEPARLRLYAKLAHLIEPGVDTVALPPEAALARAVTLLRTSPESAEARALLAMARDRADASPAVQAAALWELAALDLRSTEVESRRRAVDALRAFVQLSPPPPRERHIEAAELLDRLAETLAREPGVDASVRGQLDQARLTALRQLVDLGREMALDRAGPADPARVASWHARLLALQATRADPATVTADELAAMAAAQAAPALSAATTADAELHRRAVARLFASVRQEPQWSARSATQRLALANVLLEASRPRDAGLQLLVARTLIELDRPGDAASSLRPLLNTEIDAPAHPMRPSLRLLLAEALQATGDPAARTEALTLLRELTAPHDDLPPTAPRPPHYWPAWALALDLLRLDAATPEQADAIRAQLTRLELIDKSLGGPEHAAAFARIRAALTPR